MRIQIRLSKEARIILEEEKLKRFRIGIEKTSGEIIDEIIDDFMANFKKIDWDYVRTQPKYDGIMADYTLVNPTSLNLKETTLGIIEDFRRSFNSELQMKRTVYRSYIIRMSLKAYKLEKEGINIYKK